MKVTLLGHASMLVEMDGRNVLVDPVFQDPFSDGAVAACPAREVYPDRFPRLDAVFLSHLHLDHFDVRSLVQLPRTLPFLCPEDPAIVYGLNKLGFMNIRMLAPDTRVDLGNGCELLTTLSSTDVIEVGVVFRDRSGTFWNEVDSVVVPATIRRVQAAMGHVDLLFSGYAAQNVRFFETMRAGYPLDIATANLANVKMVGPTLVVPGSAGYRFAGLLEWANPFLFPVSRQAFLEDLARVAPEVPAALANPGDVFELAAGRVTRQPAASTYARMIEDDTWRVAFDASAPVPRLTDPNPLGYSPELIDKQVTDCFDGVERLVRAVYTGDRVDALIDGYRRTGFSYSVGVIYPDGHERWLYIAFEPAAPRVVRATTPIRGAIASHRVAASMLTARARYERGYLYYRGFFRLTQTFLGTRVEAGSVFHESDEPDDLLGYYLANKAPGAERAAEARLDFQIESLRREGTG